MVTNHYDVLGVGEAATQEDIKRAYYGKARSYHPDSHAGSSTAVLGEAQRAMSELNGAWNVLRDKRLRREYDRVLAERSQPTMPPGQSRRRPPQAQRKSSPQSPALAMAQGFRSWLSVSGGSALRDARGRPRFNLSVHGATDLAPLRTFAPDGIWGLHAEHAAIGDDQLVHLTVLHGLQLLDVSSTGVTDAGLVHLQGLRNLETLYLWDTAITDDGLRLVARIPTLRLLGLGRTRVSDAGLAHVARLERLRVLQLWGTDVAGPGLVHLHGLPDLEIVSLPRRVRGRHRRRLKAVFPGAVID